MKYIKTFESITDNIRFVAKSDGVRYRINMYVNDGCVGDAIVMIKDDIFSRWDLNNDVYESIPDTKCLYIFGISVAPGEGWGSKFVKYIEDFAREHECEYVTLGSITKALGFWKKMGYKTHSIDEYYNMYKKVSS